MSVHSAALICTPRLDDGVLLKKSYEHLSSRMEVQADPVAAEKLGLGSGTALGEIAADVVVVFGGDGTLLYTLGHLHCNPLVLGVNTGSVGHLMEITKDGLDGALDRILSGDYHLDERTRLSIDGRLQALNEVALVPEQPTSLLEFRLELADLHLESFRSDGLIIATPTGSTGYALSAGGPLLHPDTPAYLICPINPFRREHVSLVVPDNQKLVVEPVREHRNVHLVVDGRVQGLVSPHQKIILSKSEQGIRFIRFSADARNRHILYNRQTL